MNAVDIPVMADGEDGFGDVATIPSVIRDFVNAGVAGINIEDQVLENPTPNQVMGRDAAVDKIRTARCAAREEGESDLVINGRTGASCDSSPAARSPQLRRSSSPQSLSSESCARAVTILSHSSTGAVVIASIKNERSTLPNAGSANA